MSWSKEDRNGISYHMSNEEFQMVSVYGNALYVDGVCELAARISEDIFQLGQVPSALPYRVKVYDPMLGDLVDAKFTYMSHDDGYNTLTIEAYTRAAGIRKAAARWARV